jgi:hypothetical protein
MLSVKQLIFVSSLISIHIIITLLSISCYLTCWTFFAIYLLATLCLLVLYFDVCSSVSISSVAYLFDFLLPLNFASLLNVQWLLLMLGFVPTLSFYFKLFLISYLTSCLCLGSMPSNIFGVIILVSAYILFVYQSYLIRTFVCVM